MPGDPSIMYTIQKNQLAELQHRFQNTVGLLKNSSSMMNPENPNFQSGFFTNQFEGTTLNPHQQTKNHAGEQSIVTEENTQQVNSGGLLGATTLLNGGGSANINEGTMGRPIGDYNRLNTGSDQNLTSV
mmetsp:Transcript_4115/g.6958  ORF Transcript_4115/g.6958 Transcript_4115/m.6958 type:complete len:129 (-) Transcript_4115:79-465(-)